MGRRKRGRYPSQVRYDEDHPVISIRVTLHENERLLEESRSSGKPVSVIVREVLGLQLEKSRYKSTYRTGYTNGYREAETNYRIWYFCSICGQRLWMIPNDKDHKAMIESMKKAGWAHSSCHEKRKREMRKARESDGY